MKKQTLTLLAILICTQLAVPFTMIWSKEKILRDGELFRFKTRPIDPADPFQGRFVRLGFQNDYIPCPKDHKPELRHKEAVYLILETGSDGFAKPVDWSREKPTDGNYLKTRYAGIRSDWNRDTRKRTHQGLRFAYPFNRFYMDETKAPRAEKLAREATRSTNCWANVRILNGNAVIEDVFAEGKSLRELAAKKDE